MRNVLKFAFIMFLAVLCSACVNTAAVHELNELAADYLEAGDTDTAISRLESSIDLDDQVYESRYNLAVAYMRKNYCEKAYENIKVALELEDSEPAVYYTHAVSLMCLADRLWEETNQDGQIVKKVFKTKLDKDMVLEKYVAYLKDANTSFDMYIKLAPNADDMQSVVEHMRKNQDEIAKSLEQLEE